MPGVLDIEQAVLLLELDPPFDQRDVQLARRRLAKVWHPDLAPPGRQFEHERHLKAINEAADQLISLAEGSRGGRVSKNAVKVSAAAARKARAEEGRRAYEAERRRREQEADRRKHDPFGSRVPDHSVVHRYARCLSYPEWGVGSVTGIYFTGDGDDVQQWARVKFAPGVRTVPAGSLQFVDFSKPDPGAERVRPRVDGDRPAAHRFAARIYEDMGAIDLAAEAADRAAARGPEDADAWERVGRLRLRLMDRPAAIAALERARRIAPSVEGLLDLALAHHLAGDLGAEVTATEQATLLDPESAAAWTRFAHALARTDRVSDAIGAAERALDLDGADGEVADLLERLRAAQPRVLPAA
jgi:tetratricopeptide (TPR) repeat protein